MPDTLRSLNLSSHDPARGARLTAAMQSRGYTLNCQICFELGVTESSLSRWRSGEAMSVPVAIRLAEILEVSLDWLIVGRARHGLANVPRGSRTEETLAHFHALSRTDSELIVKLSRLLVAQEQGQQDVV